MATYKPIPTLSDSQQHSFWERVRVDMVDSDACWEWTGYRTTGGYGRIMIARGPFYAHRVAYTLVHGPVPDTLTLDHCCRNRACCNPAHLEAVSIGENARRGDAIFKRRKAQTHCTHGHEFTSANTLRRRDGRRQCRECKRIVRRELKQWRSGKRRPVS